MRTTARTQPRRRFSGYSTRLHSTIERALATITIACVLGGFLPALAHAQGESQPRKGKPVPFRMRIPITFPKGG